MLKKLNVSEDVEGKFNAKDTMNDELNHNIEIMRMIKKKTSYLKF